MQLTASSLVAIASLALPALTAARPGPPLQSLLQSATEHLHDFHDPPLRGPTNQRGASLTTQGIKNDLLKIALDRGKLILLDDVDKDAARSSMREWRQRRHQGPSPRPKPSPPPLPIPPRDGSHLFPPHARPTPEDWRRMTLRAEQVRSYRLSQHLAAASSSSSSPLSHEVSNIIAELRPFSGPRSPRIPGLAQDYYKDDSVARLDAGLIRGKDGQTRWQPSD